jgi:hypothetical protein
MYASIKNSSYIFKNSSTFYLGLTSEVIKRHILISDVSAATTTLCREPHFPTSYCFSAPDLHELQPSNTVSFYYRLPGYESFITQKPTSDGTSRDSCGAQDSDKWNALSFIIYSAFDYMRKAYVPRPMEYNTSSSIHDTSSQCVLMPTQLVTCTPDWHTSWLYSRKSCGLHDL